MTIPWLTILALLPAIGAVVLIFTGARAAKQVALAVSLISVRVGALVDRGAVQRSAGGMQDFVEQVPWIKPLGRVLRARAGRSRRSPSCCWW